MLITYRSTLSEYAMYRSEANIHCSLSCTALRGIRITMNTNVARLR